MMLSRSAGCKASTNLPLLHMSQSLALYDNISFLEMHHEADGELEVDPPMKINLKTRITCVKPRTIGTFITWVTSYHESGKCISTSKVVALILGLNPDKIIPLDEAPMLSTKETTKLLFQIPNNASLLYRLNGDYSNTLTGNVPDVNNKPVLHGLCTVGYALRAVMRYVHGLSKRHEQYEMKLSSLECSFVKPVFVNDVLHIEIWDDYQEKCLSEDLCKIFAFECFEYDIRC